MNSLPVELVYKIVYNCGSEYKIIYFFLTNINYLSDYCKSNPHLLKSLKKNVVKYEKGIPRLPNYKKHGVIEKVCCGCLNVEKYRDGLLHGTIKSFHRNGSIAFSQKFRNGVCDGETEIWSENKINYTQKLFKGGYVVLSVFISRLKPLIVKMGHDNIENFFIKRAEAWLNLQKETFL